MIQKHKKEFIVFILMLTIHFLGYSQSMNQNIKDLDETIKKVDVYDSIKVKRINTLKKKFYSSYNKIEKINLCQAIFDEYKIYKSDSAYHYALEMNILAQKINSKHWINKSKLQMAEIFTVSSMYPEAINLLITINKNELSKELKIEYFKNFFHAYLEWAEYSQYNYSIIYKSESEKYRDSLFTLLPKESLNYAIETSWRMIQNKELNQAESLLLSNINKVGQDKREYAILSSLLSILYYYKQDYVKQKAFLITSAISDIKSSTKENTSLRSLSEILFIEGDIERAIIYIKKSLSDANYYNARLRSLQTAKSYPIIEQAYQKEASKRKTTLLILLSIISLLSIGLIILYISLIKQYKKLAIARKETLIINEHLEFNNRSLSEANLIKESYLGLFLRQCATYIDKMEKHQRNLLKKANGTENKELIKELKSYDFIEEELESFYSNFDEAFLDIFPDFISQFNNLLHENEQIQYKKEHKKLNSELRVFALMRLGITDGQKIAAVLHYSVTTIYNYKSKYRNKARVPKNNFEEEVMKISSYQQKLR